MKNIDDFTHKRTLLSGEVAGFNKELKMLALGLTEHGYRIHYEFTKPSEALEAIICWDGEGHPPWSWIKVVGNDEYGVRVDGLINKITAS